MLLSHRVRYNKIKVHVKESSYGIFSSYLLNKIHKLKLHALKVVYALVGDEKMCRLCDSHRIINF